MPDDRADQSVLVGIVHGTQLTNRIKAGAGQLVPLGKRLLDPFQRWMTSVLHLDPIWRPAGVPSYMFSALRPARELSSRPRLRRTLYSHMRTRRGPRSVPGLDSSLPCPLQRTHLHKDPAPSLFIPRAVGLWGLRYRAQPGLRGWLHSCTGWHGGGYRFGRYRAAVCR
jgi:hypothetical protein